MTVGTEDITAAIDELREILQLDGADIAVEGVSDGRAELTLVLEGASCRECVLPRPKLEAMFLARLQEEGLLVDEVLIHDPREDATE
jgi:Fe-S cluster biogenesis protein NfuA